MAESSQVMPREMPEDDADYATFVALFRALTIASTYLLGVLKIPLD